MRIQNITFTIVAVFIWTSALAASQKLDGDSTAVNPHLVPDPKYSPRDVVEIQVNAMMHNSVPYQDAGIEITFRFASPSNKSQTGPLDRFIKLVNNAAYAPMLDASSVEYGETHIDGSSNAQVPVIVTARDGSRAGYLFTLGLQTETPYENCWMTNAVVRFRLKGEHST